MWTNDDKLAEKSNQFSVRFVRCANMWLHHYIISSILFLYKQVASLGLKNRSRIYIAIQTAIMDFCNVWCKMCLISCKVCWLVVIHGSNELVHCLALPMYPWLVSFSIVVYCPLVVCTWMLVSFTCVVSQTIDRLDWTDRLSHLCLNACILKVWCCRSCKSCIQVLSLISRSFLI